MHAIYTLVRYRSRSLCDSISVRSGCAGVLAGLFRPCGEGVSQETGEQAARPLVAQRGLRQPDAAPLPLRLLVQPVRHRDVLGHQTLGASQDALGRVLAAGLLPYDDLR